MILLTKNFPLNSLWERKRVKKEILFQNIHHQSIGERITSTLNRNISKLTIRPTLKWIQFMTSCEFINNNCPRQTKDDVKKKTNLEKWILPWIKTKSVHECIWSPRRYEHLQWSLIESLCASLLWNERFSSVMYITVSAVVDVKWKGGSVCDNTSGLQHHQNLCSSVKNLFASLRT